VGRAHGRDAGSARGHGADTASEDLRGTAYGFFNLMSGLALLGSSVIAGVLWGMRGRRSRSTRGQDLRR